jgi:hypothetical protein
LYRSQRYVGVRIAVHPPPRSVQIGGFARSTADQAQSLWVIRFQANRLRDRRFRVGGNCAECKAAGMQIVLFGPSGYCCRTCPAW